MSVGTFFKLHIIYHVKRIALKNLKFSNFSAPINSVHILRVSLCAFLLEPGGRLNKKDGLTRYGDSHVKDKTS